VYYGGGGFDTGWDMLSNPPQLKGYTNSGHRYYYGTQNAALFKGIAKAIEFQNKIGRENIENRVKQLANYLQEQLLGMGNGIEMLTPTESISKAAQVSFKLKDKDAQKLHTFCNEKKIITRYVAENNINCLRVSTHIYNSYSDIDAFLKALDVFLHSS
jgi:selenocysteine lyase/cysteine desulfurase